MELKPATEPTEETPTMELEPGFYVTANDVDCGPFLTAADAEAYISGQLAPQDTAGTIKEV